MTNLITYDDMDKLKLYKWVAEANHFKKYGVPQILYNKQIALLFEKPSLRTKTTFEIAIKMLGGNSIYLDHQSKEMRDRESIKDLGRNLGQWCDGIVGRVYRTETLFDLAIQSKKPVINALCNLWHPCQGVADIMTISNHFKFGEEVKVAYFGDPNNVSNTLAYFCPMMNWKIKIVCPQKVIAERHLGEDIYTSDVNDVKGFDVAYTDSWISMGDDKTLEEIKDLYMPYQINRELMTRLKIGMVLHCQPAHRGLEITDDIMDDYAKNYIDEQSCNRLWTEVAILSDLIK